MLQNVLKVTGTRATVDFDALSAKIAPVLQVATANVEYPRSLAHWLDPIIHASCL
mgnify:CR=1 FL=1